ncbi:formate dehydrogenase accessory sulfurtransferase FdhD [Pseudoduganella chitinolytica]|uniref:Sulfur carrier protein FdhD n=1 Tax=Pseudoduganella chitinolytica TaxID=34070 RepID=A0ABY8BG06_9BURK|nr:formate dehydrogenase accessory sulfurtransferase FdhD [Pseudoduganella chitinolytica]WEF34616.1 formate dehydrogenase accessory sulfurtransferase FdhD [Pseudoduganella chitinolytica]
MNAGARHLLPAGAALLPAQAWRDDVLAARAEVVPDEVPVALVYNGIAHAVMLASPADLEDFALGFTLGERIVRHPRDVYDIEIEEDDDGGIVIAMHVAAGALARLKETRRARTGRTGCGLCGVESLRRFADDTADMAPCRALATSAAATPIAPAALRRAMTELAARQHLHHATGGTHAAGWAAPDGALHCLREDVGRHNALDKLVGALARDGTSMTAGFAVVTSRASYEMVQKAARAGIGLLAAVSAPTALAIRMADLAGLTLAGFVRDDRYVLYTHPRRLAGQP